MFLTSLKIRVLYDTEHLMTSLTLGTTVFSSCHVPNLITCDKHSPAPGSLLLKVTASVLGERVGMGGGAPRGGMEGFCICVGGSGEEPRLDAELASPAASLTSLGADGRSTLPGLCILQSINGQNAVTSNDLTLSRSIQRFKKSSYGKRNAKTEPVESTSHFH